ncbi:MAG TPA: hypothetical protein VGS08_04645 [Candidatus Saccharimonadales bacterium]|nr:hypothetical protein [Candidatus Saccharimonadales bacterium]
MGDSMFGGTSTDTQMGNVADPPATLTPPTDMSSLPVTEQPSGAPATPTTPTADGTDSDAVSPAVTPSYGGDEQPAADLTATPADNGSTSGTTVEPSLPATTSSTPPAGTDDLLDIKRQALQQLSPLLQHLDQTPEERFRTTMMMIQASDDSSLIKTAYDAAQQITDEKARAQALLDVVNETNYFTQHEASDNTQP